MTSQSTVLEYSSGYAVSCSPKTWFEEYANIEKWYSKGSQALVDHVHSVLKKEGILSEDGWVPILTLFASSADESTIFKAIGSVTEAVSRAAHSFDRLPQRTYNENGNTLLSLNNVESAVIAEYKAMNNTENIHAVGHLPKFQ